MSWSKRYAGAPSVSDSRNQTPAPQYTSSHASPRDSVATARPAEPEMPPRAPARPPRLRRAPLSTPPTVAPGEARKPMIFEDETSGENDFENLGALLVYLRDTYGQRTGYTDHGPAFEITALAIAEKLTEYGYHMTSGSYSFLEHGQSLPKNPELFFEAICKVLAVKKSSKYWVLLRYQYLFDHARLTVGDTFAFAHCPHGQQALDLLKQGVL